MPGQFDPSGIKRIPLQKSTAYQRDFKFEVCWRLFSRLLEDIPDPARSKNDLT
jgi:hypothetical protein